MNTGFSKKISCIAFAMVLLFGALPAWALTATQMAKLFAGDGAPNDYFGQSVAVDGDTAVIGVQQDDDNGSTSGSAYVFTRSGAKWTRQGKRLSVAATTRSCANGI